MSHLCLGESMRLEREDSEGLSVRVVGYCPILGNLVDFFFGLSNFQTLSEARSQLYQRRFLRPRRHFSAFCELYIFSFVPFQNFVIFKTFALLFAEENSKTEKKVDQITEDLRIPTPAPKVIEFVFPLCSRQVAKTRVKFSTPSYSASRGTTVCIF